MEKTNENFVKELNKLVEINNDRIEGYERAANETVDQDLKDLFTTMATHSRVYRSELDSEIRALGGKPTEGTRNSGKIFRVWMDIKAALTGKNRKEIIASCEYGEDAALEAYDEVLNSDALYSGNVRKMIIKQREEILQDHDRIKALRDKEKVK
jgi:uncharacterized protein (TIGR02284 family)